MVEGAIDENKGFHTHTTRKIVFLDGFIFNFLMVFEKKNVKKGVI